MDFGSPVTGSLAPIVPGSAMKRQRRAARQRLHRARSGCRQADRATCRSDTLPGAAAFLRQQTMGEASRMAVRLRAWIVVALAVGAVSTGLAQTHLGAIRGTVLDPTGATVAEAALTVVHVPTGVGRKTTTSVDGAFVLTQLPPGNYRIDTARDGYKTHVSQTTLQVSQRLSLEIRLEIGAITEQVVVTADALIDRESVALTTVVDNAQIVQLPLDGRNFLELALLAPGTSPAAQGSAASVRGDFAMSVNGAREDANAFLLDGGYNVDPKLNTSSVRPPVDAIKEFRVLTNTYDASFGRHAGGQVNVTTMAGSNRFSGMAYEFFRTQALNATNAFAPSDQPAPDYRRSQFGLSIGGPVVRNQTFFFADYEGLRLDEGITQIANVPTAAERQGDFSASLLLPPTNPVTGQRFPGDVIPAPFVDPIGGAIANLYPLPNRAVPFENHVDSPTLRDRNDHVDVRVDHLIGAGSTLMARYSLGDRRLFEPFSGPGFAAVPGFGSDIERRAQNLVVGLTQVVSPSIVNDLRVVYNRVSAGVFHENLGNSLSTAVGLPELSDNPRDFGLSFITITGYSPLGDEFNNPQRSTTNTVQLLDSLTYVRGRHLLKFGADALFTRQEAFRDVQSRGFLTFSSQPNFTGNALADLLLGLPLVTGGARLDNPQRLRTESINLFVQDEIRLDDDLTLSAGLRYEVISPPVDVEDRANVFDPVSGTIVQVGTEGVPRSGYATDTNNVAPRVGLAWAPGGRGDTVIRGGYGIYYNQSALAPGEGLYFNPPYFDFNLYFPLPGLPLTLANPFPEQFPLPTPPSALAFDPALKTPWLEQWSVGVQRKFGGRRAIEIAYVGSRGHDLLTARDINQPEPSPVPVNRRPDPRFGDIVSLESTARSRYDALQVTAQQRMRDGLTLHAAYTLGKSTDDASDFFTSAGDPNFPQDSNNPGADHGRSSFDVRHRFTASFAYVLPFGAGQRWASEGWAARVLGDWTIAGIFTAESGAPFTVALLPEIDNSNTGRAALGFGANDRPSLSGNAALRDPSAAAWFDTDAFTFPAFGSFGNAGRNILDGPGYQNLNLAVLKLASLSEGVNVQLRLEAFNVLNRVNLGLPDVFLGSPTFGRILTAGPARRLQLGLKLIY
ncbi:MAG TPA: hypothetical protein DCP38_08705 [Acidobacteria bacterium]|nr:hypothetical protein [Acidobacteriota bacterium]